MGLFKDRKEHPSYGMISWNRQTHGGGSVLFGSDLKHTEVVSLRISHAVEERGLNTDWFYEKARIIEVHMSPVQFAQFLTSPNSSGVPCTLHQIGSDSIEKPDFIPKVEIFKKEFQEDIKSLDKLLVDMVLNAEALSEAPRVSKKDMKELKNQVDQVKRELSSNMPFLYEQFVKSMSKTVQAAKSEVEAYVDRRIHETGLAVLQEESVKLLENRKGDGTI